MKRKIIRQGHDTLTITLPKEWTRRFNLSAGSEVELTEKDNGIYLTSEKIGENKCAEFDITKMDIPTIWKYLMSIYREGYDDLRIHFNPGMKLENPYKFFTQHRTDIKYKKKGEQRNIISVLQSFIDRFIGWEIVEHGRNYIQVKEMGESTSKQFDNAFRRVFLLIEGMSEDTVQAIKMGDVSYLEETHDVDINLDKFHDYCIRILNKNANKDSKKTNLLFSTLYLIELVGDEFKNIATHLMNDFKKLDFKSLENFTGKTKEMIDCYKDIYYKFEQEKINRFSEIDKEIYFGFPKAYKLLSEDEKEIMHHLRMINRYLNALLELRIEMEF